MHLFASCLCCCTLKYLCHKSFFPLRFSLCIFSSLIFVSSTCSFAFITRRARCVIDLYLAPLISKSQPETCQVTFVLFCGAVIHKIILLVLRNFFLQFCGLCDFSCMFLHVLLLVVWLIDYLLICWLCRFFCSNLLFVGSVVFVSCIISVTAETGSAAPDMSCT